MMIDVEKYIEDMIPQPEHASDARRGLTTKWQRHAILPSFKRKEDVKALHEDCPVKQRRTPVGSRMKQNILDEYDVSFVVLSRLSLIAS